VPGAILWQPRGVTMVPLRPVTKGSRSLAGAL
jgi:hypothetical protein